MEPEIIVALVSLVGTLAGTFGGIVMSSKLTIYRIEQLELKVNKHNNLIERMYRVEGEVTEIHHDVNDLKKYHQ